MSTTQAGSGGKIGVWLALAIAAAHPVVAVFLTGYLLGAAYDFDGSGGVGSREELYKLGEGPKLGFLGIWAAMIPVPFAASVLWHSGHRALIWLAPALGIVLSFVACQLAIASFQMPEPTIGG